MQARSVASTVRGQLVMVEGSRRSGFRALLAPEHLTALLPITAMKQSSFKVKTRLFQHSLEKPSWLLMASSLSSAWTFFSLDALVPV